MYAWIGFGFACFILFSGNVSGQALIASRSEEGIEITDKGKKVLFFQARPKSLNGKYERAGYIHPLYGLNEKSITEDMPEDHPHHHGIFWGWHQIIWKGKPIADGWSYENISWEPVKLILKKRKENIAIHSEMNWKVKLQNGHQMNAVKEKVIIRVFKSAVQYRIIDFDIRLNALVDDLEIGGSDNVWGYGGFSLRLNVPDDISFAWDDKKLTPRDSGVLAPWINFMGSFEGKSLPGNGVAVFPKPLDSGAPSSWIINANPSMQNVRYPGRIPVALSRKGLRLRYRVIIHDGSLDDETLKNLYAEYLLVP